MLVGRLAAAQRLRRLCRRRFFQTMATTAAKYQHDELDSGEAPVRDTAGASRYCVRKIQLWPVLSVEWLALLDELKKLSRLVQLESRMALNTKVLETQGRAESEGTLWDQEQHETAIRILVEEAKVNLCLRIIHDFKRWTYEGKDKQATIEHMKQTYDFQDQHITHKLSQFEEYMGLLLCRALVHVETLQLMDIPLLIEHIGYVLSRSGSGGTSDPKMQETLVLYYFASLMKHAEQLNNGELLAKTRENNLMRLVTMQVSEIVIAAEAVDPVRLPAVAPAVAHGFAALAYNEDFQVNWEYFFVDEAGQVDMAFKMKFLELEGRVVVPVLKDAPEKRKDLRPLLDFFRTIERSMR